jgi:hypothetical protein
MSRVLHFEVHASQPQLLIDFYSALLGWSFQKYGPMDYWLIVTGPDGQPGINGGLMPRRGAAPTDGQAVNAFVCTVGVDAVDAVVAKSLALGATIALPRMPVPGVGWLAYIKDPDGNILGLLQPDEKAA